MIIGSVIFTAISFIALVIHQAVTNGEWSDKVKYPWAKEERKKAKEEEKRRKNKKWYEY